MKQSRWKKTPHFLPLDLEVSLYFTTRFNIQPSQIILMAEDSKDGNLFMDETTRCLICGRDCRQMNYSVIGYRFYYKVESSYSVKSATEPYLICHMCFDDWSVQMTLRGLYAFASDILTYWRNLLIQKHRKRLADIIGSYDGWQERLMKDIYRVCYDTVDLMHLFGSSCWNCHRMTINRCQGCKMAFFCSEKCQTEDWDRHKHQCKEFARRPPLSWYMTPPKTLKQTLNFFSKFARGPLFKDYTLKRDRIWINQYQDPDATCRSGCPYCTREKRVKYGN